MAKYELPHELSSCDLGTKIEILFNDPTLDRTKPQKIIGIYNGVQDNHVYLNPDNLGFKIRHVSGYRTL